MGAEAVTRCKYAERLAVFGVDCNRLLQKRLRHFIILPRDPPIMRQRTHHQLPRIHTVGVLAPHAKVFRRIELRFDGSDDRFCNFVLDSEHIGEVAIVALRPNMAPGRDVI